VPDVLMPRLSDSMEEGTVLRWLVDDGAEVARGDEIVELETDKATMAYEADFAGTLSIVAAPGDTVAVGALIATIGEPSAAADAAPAAAPLAEVAPPVEAAPRAAAAVSATGNGEVTASPVARRFALAHGIELAARTGSGPRGRILKSDVRGWIHSAPAKTPSGAEAPAEAVAANGAKGAVTVQELSRLQQTVARRMAESRATVPDFTVSVDADMAAVLDLREQLRAGAEVLPSINDIIVKLAARTLRRHPRVNGAYRDGRFELYEHVNVGIAVAAGDGLVVPTIHNADRLSLTELATESRRLAQRVRDGAVSPQELAGGTFTISNLGMFGVDRFAGVINPPQAAILCVGAVAKRATVHEDQLAIRPLLTLTLVSDHRIIYGADAAAFLADLRAGLESPLGALL
jgi:pyruvate dehydrogenase E2 component (dihydrolipoamide acetyltransferase)